MKETYFADPTRTTPKELEKEINIASSNSVITGLLKTLSGLLAVIDENRQLVAFNDSFFRFIGIDDPAAVLGLRPGKALGCIHCDKAPNGCGTGKFCQSCGAAIAIVSSLKEDKPVEKVCALSINRGKSTVDMALLVKSQPIKIDDNKFLLIFLQDITRQQQRAALERVFFHDVNNYISAIVNASELLVETENSEIANLIFKSSLRVAREISIQKTLSQECDQNYYPEWTDTDIKSMLNDLEEFILNHVASKNRTININRNFDNKTFVTDTSLFQRVLSNMAINALEATPENEKISIWTDFGENNILFSIWNKGCIPDQTAMRVFQRNFTTKEQDGRGIGTYSMKLFGEKILGGKISFTSSKRDGTVFRFIHPITR